jgi:hypothetical protein
MATPHHWEFLRSKLGDDIVSHCIQPFLLPPFGGTPKQRMDAVIEELEFEGDYYHHCTFRKASSFMKQIRRHCSWGTRDIEQRNTLSFEAWEAKHYMLCDFRNFRSKQNCAYWKKTRKNIWDEEYVPGWWKLKSPDQ